MNSKYNEITNKYVLIRNQYTTMNTCSNNVYTHNIINNCDNITQNSHINQYPNNDQYEYTLYKKIIYKKITTRPNKFNHSIAYCIFENSMPNCSNDYINNDKLRKIVSQNLQEVQVEAELYFKQYSSTQSTTNGTYDSQVKDFLNQQCIQKIEKQNTQITSDNNQTIQQQVMNLLEKLLSRKFFRLANHFRLENNIIIFYDHILDPKQVVKLCKILFQYKILKEEQRYYRMQTIKIIEKKNTIVNITINDDELPQVALCILEYIKINHDNHNNDKLLSNCQSFENFLKNGRSPSDLNSNCNAFENFLNFLNESVLENNQPYSPSNNQQFTIIM